MNPDQIASVSILHEHSGTWAVFVNLRPQGYLKPVEDLEDFPTALEHIANLISSPPPLEEHAKAEPIATDAGSTTLARPTAPDLEQLQARQDRRRKPKRRKQ